MAVLDPVLVTINNLTAFVEGSSGPQLSAAAKEGASSEVEVSVPNFPHDPTRGSHTIRITEKAFINRSDCSLVKNEVQ